MDSELRLKYAATSDAADYENFRRMVHHRVVRHSAASASNSVGGVLLWWFEWKLSRLFLWPSSSLFAYYSSIILWGSGSDQAHIWRIGITEFLVSVVIVFFAAAHDVVLMCKTAGPKIAEEGFGVLVSLSEQPVRWIDDLGAFGSIIEISFDSALANVLSCLSREVHWDRV